MCFRRFSHRSVMEENRGVFIRTGGYEFRGIVAIFSDYAFGLAVGKRQGLPGVAFGRALVVSCRVLSYIVETF